MNDDIKLILEDNGKEIEAQVIFTCFLEETGKHYCVFVATGKNGKKELSAAVYEESDDLSGQMSPVETDEEWEILEEYLNAYAEENDLDIDALLK